MPPHSYAAQVDEPSPTMADEHEHEHHHGHHGRLSRTHSFVGDVVEDMPPEETIKEERGKSLGVKSIGTWLSFIFVINQIYGPGVLAIPIVYKQSGVIPTFFMVTFFLAVSSLAATCLSQAIASIPDNRQYQQRVEFATAVEFFYGHKWHYAFQICLNITVQAYNIASVVICAQSLDQAFVSLSGNTYAFEFGPNFGFNSYGDTDALYNSNHVCISIGYMIITLFFMPAGFLNLNDNVKTVQVGSFIFLIILMLEFIGFFIWRGNNQGYHSVPAFGDSYTQLVSVFIFSWAYVIFVPSWLNEKSVETSVNKVIWSAGIASWFGYIAIGWLCAAVFTIDEISVDDMLVVLSKGKMPIITRITSHLFSLGVIAPGIPVCSVTTRYNLFIGGICGKKGSYFWGCVAPWLVGWIFCQGQIFANLLNWTSLIFNGLVNFLIPFLMYLTSLKLSQAGGAPPITDSPTSAIAGGINRDSTTDGDDYSVDDVDENRTRANLASAYSASVQASGNSLDAPLLADADASDIEPRSSPKAALPGSVLLAVARSDSELESGGGPRFCLPQHDPNYQHGPVFPLPTSFRPYAYQFILSFTVVTQIVIVLQIGIDLYYAIIGQNVLSQ